MLCYPDPIQERDELHDTYQPIHNRNFFACWSRILALCNFTKLLHGAGTGEVQHLEDLQVDKCFRPKAPMQWVVMHT